MDIKQNYTQFDFHATVIASFFITELQVGKKIQ